MAFNIRPTHRLPGHTGKKGWGGLALLLCLSGGCESAPNPEPPPPAPPATVVEQIINLQPLNKKLVGHLGEDNIHKFQYYISSRVILTRESSQVVPRNNDGILELTNTSTSERITIEGKTKGVVSKITNQNGKKVLWVCFEAESDDSLMFLESGEEGFFTLYVPNGTISYGKETYRVEAEKTTRLLINMETRDDVQNDQRNVYGRTLDPNTAPAEIEPYTAVEDPQREEDARLLRVLESYLTQIEEGKVHPTSRELDDIRQAMKRIKARNSNSP